MNNDHEYRPGLEVSARVMEKDLPLEDSLRRGGGEGDEGVAVGASEVSGTTDDSHLDTRATRDFLLRRSHGGSGIGTTGTGHGNGVPVNHG